MNKNVLFLIDKNGFGGVQTIAKGLIRHTVFIPGISMFFLYLRNISTLEKSNKKNIFYSKYRSKYNFNSLFYLLKIIKKEKISILHLNGDKSLIFGLIVKKIFPKIKIIHHEHGPLLKNSFFYVNLLKMSKSSIDFFIAVSDNVKNILIYDIGISSTKVLCVPNFIDSDKFNGTKGKNRNAFLQSTKNIGYVGRLTEEKGVEYLLKSLPFLKIKYRVIIIGDGILKKYLTELTLKMGVANNVFFLGYQNVPKFNTLDVLIVPSLRESFGISVIEAQASGVPVIASNVGGLGELVKDGETGLLFESKNVLNLANQIERLFANQCLYEKIVKQGKKQSIQYSLKSFIENIKSVYDNL